MRGAISRSTILALAAGLFALAPAGALVTIRVPPGGHGPLCPLTLAGERWLVAAGRRERDHGIASFTPGTGSPLWMRPDDADLARQREVRSTRTSSLAAQRPGCWEPSSKYCSRRGCLRSSGPLIPSDHDELNRRGE